MLYSLLKHYLDTDTALKVSQSVYCLLKTISLGCGVGAFLILFFHEDTNSSVYVILQSKRIIVLLISNWQHFQFIGQ